MQFDVHRDLIKILQWIDDARKTSAARWRNLFAVMLLCIENPIICQQFSTISRLANHSRLWSIRLVFDKRRSSFWNHRHRLHVSFKLQLNYRSNFTLQCRPDLPRIAAVIEYNLRADDDSSEPYVVPLKILLSVKAFPADKPHELYVSFSIYKNGAKLFDVSRNQPLNVLNSLPGLRTFAMLHIMLGHRFNWSRGFPNVNASVFATDGKWMKTFFSALVNIHPIAVDSFFVMGGLLLARSILHNIEKYRKTTEITRSICC